MNWEHEREWWLATGFIWGVAVTAVVMWLAGAFA